MRVAFTCLALAIAGRSVAIADDEDNASPVKKVLKLLKDMEGQLKAEKEHEEEVYAKLSCWCDVNGKEKDAAVDAASRKIAELESTINLSPPRPPTSREASNLSLRRPPQTRSL
jgi:hypothetical protein